MLISQPTVLKMMLSSHRLFLLKMPLLHLLLADTTRALCNKSSFTKEGNLPTSFGNLFTRPAFLSTWFIAVMWGLLAQLYEDFHLSHKRLLSLLLFFLFKCTSGLLVHNNWKWKYKQCEEQSRRFMLGSNIY